MATRAGLAGFLTGLTATLILVYPLAVADSTHWIWIIATAAVMIGGGALAGHWDAGSKDGAYTGRIEECK